LPWREGNSVERLQSLTQGCFILAARQLANL
jgi:hypothetical protein